MSHLTYLEAGVVGLIQGVTELFPVSSLGHNVLIPALIGGSWANDLNVARPESPYLAFIVGMHVATAIALLIYFWRDWVRIIGGFFTSLGHWQGWHPRVATRDERLAWMIILATIPVGLVGLVAEHTFRVLFGKPILAGVFLIVNGLILYCGEKFRSRASVRADQEVAAERTDRWAATPPGGVPPGAARAAAQPGPGRSQPGPGQLEPGQQALRQQAPGGEPVGEEPVGGQPWPCRPRRPAGRTPPRGGPGGRPSGGPPGRDLSRPGLGRAAGQRRVRRSPHHRELADPGAAGGHQPGRGHHGDRHGPGAVPGRTRPGSPSCSPPRSSWPPGCSRCPT